MGETPQVALEPTDRVPENGGLPAPDIEPVTNRQMSDE